MDVSNKTATHQEEPLDLSVGNHGNPENVEQQQMAQQAMDTCSAFLQQYFLFLIQGMQQGKIPLVPIPEEPPESDTKENIRLIKVEVDEHESTPSPTQVPRRTSAGKVDRRMVGKVCTRRVEANARERNRVQLLSKQFDQLRLCLPMDEEIKVSKLAVLKVAAAYIGFLGAIVNEDEEEEDKYRAMLQLEMDTAKTLRK